MSVPLCETQVIMSVQAGKCHIRHACENDFESLEAIYRAHEGSQIPTGYFGHFAAALRSAETIYLVAEVNGEVVGGGGISDFFRGVEAVLCFGVVAPDHSHRGYGTALLLARLLFIGPGKNGTQVRLEATENSAPFFSRLKFEWYAQDWDEEGNYFFHGYQTINPGDDKVFRSILNTGGVSWDADLEEESRQGGVE